MPNLCEERFAGRRDHAAVVGELDMAVLAQRVGQRDAELAGDVVVAHARLAHRVVDADRPQARRRDRGDTAEMLSSMAATCAPARRK